MAGPPPAGGLPGPTRPAAARLRAARPEGRPDRTGSPCCGHPGHGRGSGTSGPALRKPSDGVRYHRKDRHGRQQGHHRSWRDPEPQHGCHDHGVPRPGPGPSEGREGGRHGPVPGGPRKRPALRHEDPEGEVAVAPSGWRSPRRVPLMNHLLEYGGLFAAAFLSATVFPFQSEVVLFGMLIAEHYQVWLLVAAASLGNILGSCVNWFLGRFIAHFEARRWFPLSRAQVAKVEGWYHQYGRWSLLLSWVPIIGDPLTIVAGVLREPFPIFLALIVVARTARYIVVAALTLGWM